MSFFLNEKRHPRDVCAGCAALKAFAATSAQAAQLPKHLPRRLRWLRNSQSIGRDIGDTLKQFLPLTYNNPSQ